MPAKMFPLLKLLCLLFICPTLGFDTKQRNSFLIKFGVFYNKSQIMTILFIVKYEKITLFDKFLELLGPIISNFLHVQMRKKVNKNNKGSFLSLVLTRILIVVDITPGTVFTAHHSLCNLQMGPKS